MVFDTKAFVPPTSEERQKEIWSGDDLDEAMTVCSKRNNLIRSERREKAAMHMRPLGRPAAGVKVHHSSFRH